MNVLYVTTTFPRRRVDSYAPWILQAAVSLAARGNEVAVLAPHAPGLPIRETFDGVSVRRFRYARERYETLAYGAGMAANLAIGDASRFALFGFILGMLWNTGRLLAGKQIVHAHFGPTGLAILPILRWARREGTRRLVSFYGQDVAHAEAKPWVYRRLFSAVDAVLVLSRDMGDRLAVIGCPQSKIVRMPIGVDLKEFPARPSTRKPSDPIKYLSVANFVPKKGLGFLLDAFAEVRQKLPASRLTLVGRGPLEGALRMQAASLGLDSIVDFINNAELPDPRKAVREAMQSADVFVLPSLNVAGDYGGTPIVLLEAAASGLPIVTTDDAGNREVVRHGESGIIVPPADVCALADAMLQLGQDPVRRHALGSAGRSLATGAFDHETLMDNLLSLYRGNPQ